MSMRRATGVLLVVMGLSSTGCYYDQWKAEERANRVLREQYDELAQTLENCEYMNKQKDVEIDSLTKQLDAKNQQVASLQAENEGLRASVRNLEDILKEKAAQGPGNVTIMTSALPPELDSELKKLAKEYPGVIEYDAKRGAVRWKSDLLFPLGSDQLAQDTDAMDALREFARIVQTPAAASFDVIVVGHTCTTPIVKRETLEKHPTNWHLSAHRSIAVMELLAEQDVGMDRMGVMGYGEYRPIEPNSTEEGKARNRRVEIFLVPRDTVKSMSLGIYEVKDRGLAFLPAQPDAWEGS
jgi:chemotaxis protein MotB